MSRLKDEPLEKASDDKELSAVMAVERVFGTVQCNECRFWGKMDGYIEPHDRKIIKFICPDCNTLELVTNPEYRG